MKVLLLNQGKLVAHLQVGAEQLADRSVILYDGQHYLFAGMQGAFYTIVRFEAILPPLELAVQPQPAPERRFMGQSRGEAL